MIFGLTTASDTFIKAMTQVLMTNMVKYAHIVHASTVDLLGAERAQWKLVLTFQSKRLLLVA